MKKINNFTIKTVTLLFISTMVLINGFASPISFNQDDLILDKKERTLTAPTAETYEWYLNGEKLPEKGNKIDVTCSGEYAVLLSNSDRRGH